MILLSWCYEHVKDKDCKRTNKIWSAAIGLGPQVAMALAAKNWSGETMEFFPYSSAPVSQGVLLSSYSFRGWQQQEYSFLDW
jgi:hypothetical protein